jgi:hypothetical protein
MATHKVWKTKLIEARSYNLLFPQPSLRQLNLSQRDDSSPNVYCAARANKALDRGHQRRDLKTITADNVAHGFVPDEK